MIIERIEWMPVNVQYTVNAKSREEGLSLLNKIDNGECEDKILERILKSRTIVKRNDDQEAVNEIDEEAFWKVDGKTEYDIEEVNEVNESDPVTVKEFLSGEKDLPSPLYKKTPYVILSLENVVLFSGDKEKMRTNSSIMTGYYNNRVVDIRKHDKYLADNTKI